MAAIAEFTGNNRRKTAAPAAALNSDCWEPGRTLRSYLRAAQAYMLISMPTGTSTIFGVFQVIWFSHMMVQHSHRRERKTAERLTQGPVCCALQIDLSQQAEQRSSCRCSQFFGIERSIAVPVGCVEALFDDGQIFIQRQSSVMIGIGGSEFARAQSSRQFVLVERPVVVGIEPGKQLCCGFLDLGKVKRTVRVEVKRLDRIMAGSGQGWRRSACQKCPG
jgi:hypothetical protein